MPGLTKGYLTIPDGQVHYVTAGAGEPLVLLHETPRSWESFHRMIPYLARSFRVIAFDTLGFGNSDPAPQHYGVADWGRNVLEVIDAMGIERTHVVADHTGACFGVEFAILAPDRINKLVLSGQPIFLTPEESAARVLSASQESPNPPVADGSHLVKIWDKLITQRIPGLATGDVSDDDLALITEIMTDALKAGPQAKRMQPIVYGHDVKVRLPLITCPTLAVGVAGGGITPYTKRPREVAALVPGARLYIFENADGRLQHTHAKEFSEVIESFLRT